MSHFRSPNAFLVLQIIKGGILRPKAHFWAQNAPFLYWSGGGDARTRDEIQARGAGRAGPACPPSVRPSVRACVRHTEKGPKVNEIIKIPLGFALKVKK